MLQSGIVTSVLALAGVYFLNKSDGDINIMGWYANYVLPVGALLVGFVAGSGYGLASWWTGLKIRRSLLVMVLALQAVAYVGAEYVEFRDVAAIWEEKGLVSRKTMEPLTFIEYYELKAETFAWKLEHGSTAGEPMGNWGYFFVALGALGFIAGGAVAPAERSRRRY